MPLPRYLLLLAAAIAAAALTVLVGTLAAPRLGPAATGAAAVLPVIASAALLALRRR